VETVDTYSELWRRECEARYWLSLPGKQRVESLYRIAEKRGEKAAKILADDMRAIREGKPLAP
jgi:hypothetical protein